MKKGIFVLTVIICILESSALYASDVWSKTMTSNNEIRYSIDAGTIFCAVIERADGYIDVYASDANFYANSVSYHGQVREGSVKETSTIYRGKMISEGGYNVFYAHCHKKAKELPPEVRKKFKGAYDIN